MPNLLSKGNDGIRNSPAKFLSGLDKTDSQAWWLWCFAIVVTLVLTLGIISFTVPGLILSADDSLALREWVRGLAALVVLFDLYTIHQYRQLAQIRRHFASQHELFRLITENAADMIAVVDGEGRRLYNSPAYQRVLGYSPEELQKTKGLEQVHPDDRFRVTAAAERAKVSGVGEKLEYRIRDKGGSWRILESTASAVRNQRGEVEKLVIVNRDITDRKKAEELLEFHCLHDVLTQLPNRQLFLDQLGRAISLSKRHQDYRFAVLFLDIDDFRRINDSLGHDSGNQLLLQIADRLTNSLRGVDTVSRVSTADTGFRQDNLLAKVGGDEFAILLEDVHDPTDGIRVAHRLQGKLDASFSVSGHEIVISASVGVVLSSSAYPHAQDLLRDAEIAMHRAKSTGPSACELFDRTMHSSAVKKLQVEADLRTGIERDEFKVFYQPVVSLEQGKIAGFEALSRWQRPTGLAMPAEFISIADRVGLIIPINRRLIQDACRNLKRWRSQVPGGADLFVSVNIPPRQFAEPSLANDIKTILEETGVDPTSLELEIVESVAMGNPEAATRILSELNQLGVRLSIDDFGTGYSSLSRLQQLPVHTLKIDRSFVSRMDAEKSSCEIVIAIIHLAHSLGLRVIAEGVERGAQACLLKEFGCDFAQGFYYSRPEPVEQIAKLLGVDSEAAAR